MYLFRNLITSNEMLPPGTLNLDIVTKRSRDSPDLNLIVAEAAERIASWETVAALPTEASAVLPIV